MDERRRTGVVETEFGAYRYRSEEMRLENGAPNEMPYTVYVSYRHKTLALRPARQVSSVVFTPAEARAFAAKLLEFADELDAGREASRAQPVRGR